MTANTSTGDSSAHIYLPSDDFVKKAAVSGFAAYEALVKEAETDYEGYWARLARELRFGVLKLRGRACCGECAARTVNDGIQLVHKTLQMNKG